MNLDLIVTGVKPARLVRYAAEELAKYTKELFGRGPRVAARKRKVPGVTVLLDAKVNGLSDQGYALRLIDKCTFAIDGGSPTAVMWGVYDLVERWGVRYELHGDMLPDRATMKLPARTITCEPDLKSRVWRTYNVLVPNENSWPAEDYRVLIDQLAKMRFNGIMLFSRPCDPFADQRFQGARKQIAMTNFGWRPKIEPHHPGYELFEQSGDAACGEFVNPDLSHHPDYAGTHAAGKRYIRKVFRMAHARGMQCVLNFLYTDFDPVIKKRLRERTKPQHKAAKAPVKRLAYGDWREGPDVETGRCMSINNPLFFEAMATAIQGHIDAVPDADSYILRTTEFGGSTADCDRAWKRLDRKYGLSKIASLDSLVKEARRKAEGGAADRAEQELRANIVVLYALDQLINERGFDMSKARKGAQVCPAGLSCELHRFLPLIFPRGTHYLAAFGYMPTYIATRMDTIKLQDPQAIHMSLVISLEDDNIGMVPQMTGPAVQKLVEALRSNGADGLETRQWLHSNLLPTLNYLSHAAWQRGWTPKKAYEHLFKDLCGPKAMTLIARALRRLETITEDLHSAEFGISFPVPTWITHFWQDWPKKHTPRRFAGIARAFERCADDLQLAIKASKPAGKDHLQSLERHVRHAVHYCNAMAELGLAHRANHEAAVAQQASQFNKLDQALIATADHLDRSEQLMRSACETFAQGVRDRCDLGALAALNHYNFDAISALARLARAKSQMFSCVEE